MLRGVARGAYKYILHNRAETWLLESMALRCTTLYESRDRQNYMSIRKDSVQIVLNSSESEIVEDGSYVLTQSRECEYSV